MSGVDVQSEVTIARGRGEVFAFAVEPDNAPQWYVNIQSVEWKTPRPFQIGSRVAFAARFLGRSLVYTYEVVELVEGERLVMRTAEGPFPMETTYAFEALDGSRTRMRLRNRGTPRGFSALLAPLILPAMRRANQKDLARLKQLLENHR